jgi:hypothetical protein
VSKPTGKKKARKRDPETMRELGKRSAEARRRKYGPDFMRDISQLGVDARKRIWEAGKAALNEKKG